MEPQIIDYYNEMPSGVNVIEKMNEELAQVQKENNILKDDLCKILNMVDQLLNIKMKKN